MDNLMEIINPRPKTLSERCMDYIRENPTTVAKGAAVGVAAWFVGPLVVGVVSWLPYIGAGYYVYRSASTAKESVTWYQWGRRQLKGKTILGYKL